MNVDITHLIMNETSSPLYNQTKEIKEFKDEWNNLE